jgi:anti-sigma factor RsiW
VSCSPYDLRDYFFGELAPDEQRSVDVHVKTCTECREELEDLRLTQSALLTVRDEEPPRRIAFVSDPIFEPKWWQRVWSSGARLGFASAAMLSAALLLHAWMLRPVAPLAVQVAAAAPAAVATPAAVDIQRVVAESEARQKAQFEKALAEKQQQWELEHKASLLRVQEYVEVMQKRMNVMLLTSAQNAPLRVGDGQ